MRTLRRVSLRTSMSADEIAEKLRDLHYTWQRFVPFLAFGKLPLHVGRLASGGFRLHAYSRYHAGSAVLEACIEEDVGETKIEIRVKQPGGMRVICLILLLAGVACHVWAWRQGDIAGLRLFSALFIGVTLLMFPINRVLVAALGDEAVLHLSRILRARIMH